jgi:WD40 repeat protein
MESASAFISRISRSAVFSPDARCVPLSRAFSPLPPILSPRSSHLPPFPPPPRSFLYVPIGNEVRSYSIATGAVVARFSGHAGAVTGVCMHPTVPRQLVTSSLDGTLRVWDADDGAALKTVVLGMPLVRLAAAWAGHAHGAAAAARVYAVASIQTGTGTGSGTAAAGEAAEAEETEVDTAGAERDVALQRVAAAEYPLGDEPACLQVRPPPFALSAALGPTGRRRVPTIARVVEVDLHAGAVTATLLQRRGFVTGLDARAMPATAAGSSLSSSSSSLHPSVAVAVTVRRSLYVYRCTAGGSRGVTVHRAPRLLSCVALHPLDGYVTVGELEGQMVTHFLPELTATYSPTAPATAPAPAAPATGSLLAAPGSASARRTEVHWHAHAAWAAAYAPDGSFLLTGGEESTLVLWQIPSAAAGGSSGPSKDKKSMTFVPRLGSPVRSIAAYSAGASVPATSFSSSDGTMAVVDGDNSGGGGGGSHVRDAPPVMYAVTLVDNSVVLLNGLTLRALWKVQGVGAAGLPAALPTGVALFARKAATKERERALRGALETGDAQAALRARAAPSSLFPPSPLPSLLYASTRHLRKGLVVDPRSRHVLLNGFPGRASLQLVDVAGGGGAASAALEIDVGAHNLVSRTDAEPAPPVRVTHAALSSDGSALATIEVAAARSEAGEESSTLKFWTWVPSDSRFSLCTRVDAPHKAEVTACEYHPSEHLVVTGSRDRTFKQWQRESRAPAHASAAGRALSGAAKRGGGEVAVAAAAEPSLATAYVWSCLSVGFFRDFPVTAASFSGDGSLLALAYSHIITLWAPKANALRRTLVHTGGMEEGSDAAGGSASARKRARAGADEGVLVAASCYPALTHVAFVGLTPYLVSANATSVLVWNLLTCTVAWSYSVPRVVSLAVDRIGAASSDRFALVAEAEVGTTASEGGVVCLLFSAASSVPLSLWSLASTERCSAGPGLVEGLRGGGSVAEAEARAAAVGLPDSLLDTSSFSVAFVGPSALPSAQAPAPAKGHGGNAAPSNTSSANSLLVFGPLNEFYALPTPAHTRTQQFEVDGAGAVDSAVRRVDAVVVSVGAAVSVAGSAGGAGKKGGASSLPSSSLTVVPTVVASGMAGLGSSKVASASALEASAGVLAAAAPINGPSALMATLASFGPVAAVQNPVVVFESLLGDLLGSVAAPVPLPRSSSARDADARGGHLPGLASDWGMEEEGRAGYSLPTLAGALPSVSAAMLSVFSKPAAARPQVGGGVQGNGVRAALVSVPVPASSSQQTDSSTGADEGGAASRRPKRGLGAGVRTG